MWPFDKKNKEATEASLTTGLTTALAVERRLLRKAEAELESLRERVQVAEDRVALLEEDEEEATTGLQAIQEEAESLESLLEYAEEESLYWQKKFDEAEKLTREALEAGLKYAKAVNGVAEFAQHVAWCNIAVHGDDPTHEDRDNCNCGFILAQKKLTDPEPAPDTRPWPVSFREDDGIFYDGAE